MGAGGILFVSPEGEAVDKKGILGEQYPLNLYYAYGIRNSFGIDFDPVTGKLWDTENGPFYGDEINLVEPGFNSGWAKIQGEWPIQNYSELINDSPVGKGHPPTSYELKNSDETLSHFSGNGKYSHPEFTWNHSVGVTSIKFYSSEKLGKEYENDLFVATFHKGGWIYHFDLDKDRKNLKLNGVLKDRVAGNQSELSDVIFARGFGSITDMEVSPDGFLYVLSIGKGAIYKITPKIF
jgi:glucose/arabinose dehydrogenase